MDFAKVCLIMKRGESITFGPNGRIANRIAIHGSGYIVGIRPESGQSNINCWLLTFSIVHPGNTGKSRGEKIEVFWRE